PEANPLLQLSEAENKGPPGKTHLWKPVNPMIWAPASRPGMLRRILNRFLETLSSLNILALIVVGPASFLLSLLVVYYVAGPVFFGPTLVTFWAVLVVGFVIVAEKMGYSRNFENWDFPLTPARILSLSVCFLILVGSFYLLRIVLAGTY